MNKDPMEKLVLEILECMPARQNESDTDKVKRIAKLVHDAYNSPTKDYYQFRTQENSAIEQLGGHLQESTEQNLHETEDRTDVNVETTQIWNFDDSDEEANIITFDASSTGSENGFFTDPITLAKKFSNPDLEIDVLEDALEQMMETDLEYILTNEHGAGFLKGLLHLVTRGSDEAFIALVQISKMVTPHQLLFLYQSVPALIRVHMEAETDTLPQLGSVFVLLTETLVHFYKSLCPENVVEECNRIFVQVLHEVVLSGNVEILMKRGANDGGQHGFEWLSKYFHQSRYLRQVLSLFRKPSTFLDILQETLGDENVKNFNMLVGLAIPISAGVSNVHVSLLLELTRVVCTCDLSQEVKQSFIKEVCLGSRLQLPAQCKVSSIVSEMICSGGSLNVQRTASVNILLKLNAKLLRYAATHSSWPTQVEVEIQRGFGIISQILGAEDQKLLCELEPVLTDYLREIQSSLEYPHIVVLLEQYSVPSLLLKMLGQEQPLSKIGRTPLCDSLVGFAQYLLLTHTGINILFRANQTGAVVEHTLQALLQKLIRSRRFETKHCAKVFATLARMLLEVPLSNNNKLIVELVQFSVSLALLCDSKNWGTLESTLAQQIAGHVVVSQQRWEILLHNDAFNEMCDQVESTFQVNSAMRWLLDTWLGEGSFNGELLVIELCYYRPRLIGPLADFAMKLGTHPEVTQKRLGNALDFDCLVSSHSNLDASELVRNAICAVLKDDHEQVAADFVEHPECLDCRSCDGHFAMTSVTPPPPLLSVLQRAPKCAKGASLCVRWLLLVIALYRQRCTSDAFTAADTYAQVRCGADDVQRCNCCPVDAQENEGVLDRYHKLEVLCHSQVPELPRVLQHHRMDVLDLLQLSQFNLRFLPSDLLKGTVIALNEQEVQPVDLEVALLHCFIPNKRDCSDHAQTHSDCDT